ncbi:hypothetical protein V1525DRAFT_443235 [Lipomyces kononenkoae]|uniref:Uncharacterized protein n=1 Tax=Lipomyces kononenkoae TaxID=34357 RepID=A0ACC3SZK2_LIPKO
METALCKILFLVELLLWDLKKHSDMRIEPAVLLLVFRNKWAWFNETWMNRRILAGISGFRWDEEEELFNADKAKHQMAKNSVFRFREVLRQVLDGAQATGQGALSVYSNNPAISNIDAALPNTQVKLKEELLLQRARRLHCHWMSGPVKSLSQFSPLYPLFDY